VTAAPGAQSPKEHRGLLGIVVRRPIAVLMVVLAVAVFGLVSLQKLPVTLLPDVSYPTLTVRTEYEGAAPAEVEKLVTRPLEENLAVISNLVSYRSISRAGVSDVILEFEWDTAMTFATQDVREKVDQIKARLPQGVKHPLILRYDPTLDPIMRLALYPKGSDGTDLFELRRVAEEELRRQLESLPGVAAVRVRGGYEEEWRVELAEDRLKLRGISARAVAERIGLENANVAGGVLRDGDRESLVRTLGEISTLEELEELVVGMRGTEPVRIRDIGEVLRGHKERDVITRIRGLESVEVEIFKEAGANVVQVAHAVKTRIYGKDFRNTVVDGEYDPAREQKQDTERSNEIQSGRHGRGRVKTDPAAKVFEEAQEPLAATLGGVGIQTRLLSDQSVFIEKSIDEVRNAALIGAGLAVLVLFAFLRRLSPTAIISIAIPVSVVATFAPLFLVGVTLNIMSLGGLALGIGMLVDSAIVVLESISRRREGGENPVDAAVFGTREVGLAVLASTLTTVAVFLPMVFVEGIAGEFFRDQALAVVFSLLAALLAALFFIPMLASRRIDVSADEAFGGILRRFVPWPMASLIAVQRIQDVTRRGGLWSRFIALPMVAFEIVIRLPLELCFRITVLICAGLIAAIALAIKATLACLSVLCKPLLWLFDRTYAGIEVGYGMLLGKALRTRVLVLALTAALSWLTFSRLDQLGIELVPRIHQGEFTVETELDVGTPVEETDRASVQMASVIRNALRKEGIGVAGLSTAAGVPRDVIAKAGEGRHTSKVHVRLTADGDLENLENRAKAAIRKELNDIPGVRRPTFAHPSLFTTRTTMEVEITGPVLEEIRNVADRLEIEMRDIPGLTDVQTTNRTGYPELVVRPNRRKLTQYSLNAGGVAGIIRDKIQGAVGTRVSQGDRKIDVVVRLPRDEIRKRDDVLNLRVDSDGEEPVPLRAVATVEQRPGPAEIRRVGGERAVILSADVLNLDLAGASTRIEEAVTRLQTKDPAAFREVSVRIAGQREESDRSLRSLVFAGLIAIFLVYIVMASQFESLIHPLVILFTVPLALVGVVFTLEVTDMQVSIVVLIGVILLVGIVVNNAIVLVDCVNQRRRAGLSRDDALMEAGRLRLRPILMTTATTVLGLLPLAVGLGEGAEIRTPMAITVIAGLATSTILTLVVIPVAYSLVSRSGPLRDATGAP